MDTQQRAELIGRVRVLEQRGEVLRTQLTLNPGRAARLKLEDQIADLGDDLEALRREASVA